MFVFKVFIYRGLIFGAYLKVYLNYARVLLCLVLLFWCYFFDFSVCFLCFLLHLVFWCFFVDKRELLSTGESVVSWSYLLRIINMFKATQHVKSLGDVIRFVLYS